MNNIESEELTITIKVLKVGSKKMTQSVFKQLPEKDVIDNDFNLQGKVWGKVNYRLPKQPAHETNIVWQHGNDLYRCAIRPLSFSPEQAKRHEHNHEVNLHRELPHSRLVTAVETTPEEEISKISELFNKYREIYKSLVESEQLYIAT